MIPSPTSAAVRPTSARVREALFSVLGQDLSGLRVLDAFSGSGMLGLEAASRGATVVAVERDPAVARAIVRAAAELKLAVSVVVGDVLAVAPTLGLFDGVIADPPYAQAGPEILAVLSSVAKSWLVFETASNTTLPSVSGAMVRDRPRPFGDTTLHVFRSREWDHDA